MKKMFSFILSISLLGNVLCSTNAFAETETKSKTTAEKEITVKIEEDIIDVIYSPNATVYTDPDGEVGL